MLPQNSIPIVKINGVYFNNLFYNKENNRFYIKRNEKSDHYRPLMWKEVSRSYTNKGGEEQIKTYKYINLYNPETKKNMRLNLEDWMKYRDQVLSTPPKSLGCTTLCMKCPICKESFTFNGIADTSSLNYNKDYLIKLQELIKTMIENTNSEVPKNE
jgi:hypothetical protein